MIAFTHWAIIFGTAVATTMMVTAFLLLVRFIVVTYIKAVTCLANQERGL